MKTTWIDITTTIIIDIVLAAENIIITICKNDLLQQHLFIANRQHRQRHLQILHKDIRGTLIIILIIIAYPLHLILSIRNTILYSIHCTHTHTTYSIRPPQRRQHTRMHHKIPHLSKKNKKKLLSLSLPYHPLTHFLLFARLSVFFFPFIMNITYCKHLPVYNLNEMGLNDGVE